jgi:RND family efflux transporter MFP subunit
MTTGFCLSLAALISGGCSNSGPKEGARQEQPAVKGITLAEVTTAAIPETVEVVGTVRARTSAVVSSRIPGTIGLLKVRAGDRVKKGQLLAQIDSTESLAGAAQAQAAIDEARQGVDEARTRKKLADATFERYQKLYDEQALTRQEFDIKQTERDLAAQGVARAESRLKQFQEGGRSASAAADYTKIVAPISGVITAKPADLGATVFPGQPLMTIEDEGSYQLGLAIPESLGAKVKPGTPVQVTLDSTGSSFAAQIVEVVPTADPASRTFTAKVNLTGAGLKSGAFGRAVIGTGTGATGILAPKLAVFERGALTAVWVVDSGKVARMRLVKPGRTVGDKVEILSGLSAEEKVVVGGMEKVSDGAKIE